MSEVLHKAIEHYGKETQILKAVEEMSELQKELIKASIGDGDLFNIIDEIVDVEIMLDQLKIIFSDHNLIDERRTYKMIRLTERIENGK